MKIVRFLAYTIAGIVLGLVAVNILWVLGGIFSDVPFTVLGVLFTAAAIALVLLGRRLARREA